MMKWMSSAALVLAALPPLAQAESAPADTRSVEERQQALEKQVADQDARIRELERMLQEALGAKAAQGAAPAAALPAAGTAAGGGAGTGAAGAAAGAAPCAALAPSAS